MSHIFLFYWAPGALIFLISSCNKLKTLNPKPISHHNFNGQPLYPLSPMSLKNTLCMNLLTLFHWFRAPIWTSISLSFIILLQQSIQHFGYCQTCLQVLCKIPPSFGGFSSALLSCMGYLTLSFYHPRAEHQLHFWALFDLIQTQMLKQFHLCTSISNSSFPL